MVLSEGCRALQKNEMRAEGREGSSQQNLESDPQGDSWKGTSEEALLAVVHCPTSRQGEAPRVAGPSP